MLSFLQQLYLSRVNTKKLPGKITDRISKNTHNNPGCLISYKVTTELAYKTEMWANGQNCFLRGQKFVLNCIVVCGVPEEVRVLKTYPAHA